MMLLSWISYELLDFYGLSINPNAVSLLAENESKIYDDQLSKNPNARELINKHYKDLNWSYLYSNPAASEVILRHIDSIDDWHELQKNSHDDIVKIIVKDMMKAIEKLNTKNCLNPYILKSLVSLAMNKNPAVIPVIERCVEVIDALPRQVFRSESENADHLWDFFVALSSNCNAIPLLRKYPRFIVLSSLCSNQNPETADLLRYLRDTKNGVIQFVWNTVICYERLSRNPVMYDLLIDNPKWICIYSLCENERAVEYLNDHFKNSEITTSYVIYLVRNKGIQGFSEKIKDAIIKEAWVAYNSKKDHYGILTNLSRNPGIFE